MARTPEQMARYYEQRCQKAADDAISAGRVPGHIGAPKRAWTPEREDKRKLRARRKSLNAQAKRKALRAAAAIAEGREPGRVGAVGAPVDVRKALRAETYRKFRENAGQARLDYEAKKAREKRAAIKVGTYVRMVRTIKSEADKREEAIRNSQNRRARLAAVGGRVTKADLTFLRHFQNGQCAWCLDSMEGCKPHLDHRVPIAIGGVNRLENLQFIHPVCNGTKAAKHPNEFGKSEFTPHTLVSLHLGAYLSL